MESIKVADCMSPQFVSVKPDLPIVQAASKLIEHELIGGPVVDKDGHLVGWISEEDCLKSVIQVLYYSQRVANVSDVMRTEVLTVKEDDDIVTLAEKMMSGKPKIYPVVDAKGKIKGVISRRLILRRVCAKILKQRVRVSA